MWRMGHALAVLALGWLLVAPTAVAAPAGSQPRDPVASIAREQAPPTPSQQPPGPDQPEQQLPTPQRVAIGTAGAVLIGLVVLSRKLRKKPIIDLKWKKQ
jgi:hypothetical protein